MPYPPVIPPATRTNATPQLDTHPSDHNAISQALTDIVAQLDVTAWAALTLGSGWTSTAGYPKAAYRRALGIVQLQGVIQFGGTPGAGSTVFTLPAGFRPLGIMRYGVLVNNGTAVIDVSTAGVGIWQGATSGATAGFLTLTQIALPLGVAP
jgi:hypothetical protein